MPRVVDHHSCATIYRAAPDVARYVLDPTTMPHWSAVIYQVDAPTDAVFRKGGSLRGTMHILGLNVPVVGEMAEYDPPGMRAAIVVWPVGVPPGEGGVLEHSLAVEDLGGGAVLQFRNRLTLPDWVPPEVIDDDLVRHLFDQTASFALANIKYILERGIESQVGSFAQLATNEITVAGGH
jgi:hypothetical protein